MVKGIFEVKIFNVFRCLHIEKYCTYFALGHSNFSEHYLDRRLRLSAYSNRMFIKF